MAVINDSQDKMRDIIARSAAELTGDASLAPETTEEEDGEGEGAEGTAEVPVEGEEADGTVEPEVPVVEPETPVEGAAETAAVVPAKDAAESGAPAAKVKKPEEDAFAKEHGLKAKDKHGRENRIPHSVVRDRIVPNAVKKERAKWEAEVLTPERAKVQTYETRLNAIAETERIQFEEPRRFVMMLQAIPGYKQLFDEISGGKFTAGGEKAEKQTVGTNLAPESDDPMPTADAKDADGKVLGWTHEGMEKRFAWERRQAARDGKAAALADLKPLRDRFESVAASEKTVADIDGIITLAAEWPGFAENHAAILGEIAKGAVKLDTPQKMYQAVQSAYNTVMFGAVTKTKETEEQRRDRYFTEFQETLRRAPRSSAARSTVKREEPVVVEDNASPDDRMRAIITESARRDGLIK